MPMNILTACSKVGFFLPGDGYEGSQTRRARNYLRSDWTDVEHRPKMVITQNVYEQKFENFDDDQPKSFQFSNSVSITTGNDYSQTRSFDVGVNANIPVILPLLYMSLEQVADASSP